MDICALNYVAISADVEGVFWNVPEGVPGISTYLECTTQDMSDQLADMNIELPESTYMDLIKQATPHIKSYDSIRHGPWSMQQIEMTEAVRDSQTTKPITSA